MPNESVTWIGIEEDTVENCIITANEDFRVVTSTITGAMDAQKLNLSYKIILNKNWQVQSFVARNETNLFTFAATQYETGRWKNELNGNLHEFDNCIDIDIFPTPFTNSLPLKRDPLKIGEEKYYSMLWIDLVEGKLRKDRQRYQRLTNTTYRFTSLDTNFTADIEFNNRAIVEFYPGLFSLEKSG